MSTQLKIRSYVVHFTQSSGYLNQFQTHSNNGVSLMQNED